jgi:hypothetical protein
VGVILALFYRGRWFSLAGLASVALGLIPWPSHAVSRGFIALGALLLVLQIPVAIRAERRTAEAMRAKRQLPRQVRRR